MVVAAAGGLCYYCGGELLVRKKAVLSNTLIFCFVFGDCGGRTRMFEFIKDVGSRRLSFCFVRNPNSLNLCWQRDSRVF